ncbi:MAG TPA: hypothetical protein VIP70_05880 [Nitrososphaeraceae archaeon]
MSRSSKEDENSIGEEGSTTKEVNTRQNNNIRDMLNESYTKVVSEMTKFQPQYLQSLSNLQLDYMEMVRNMRENLTFMENQVPYSNNNNNNKNNANWNIPLLYAEQVAKKQLDDFTTNISRILTINNQLTLTAMDAARENLNICNKLMNVLVEFNSNITKTWNSFCTNIT